MFKTRRQLADENQILHYKIHDLEVLLDSLVSAVSRCSKRAKEISVIAKEIRNA